MKKSGIVSYGSYIPRFRIKPDDIMKAAGVGKAIVSAALQELTNKGMVKRIARQKSAGYFVTK